MKKLRTLLTLLMVGLCSWQSAWAQEVEVSVTLLEPGSLGVEILRKHDPITEVTNLTITGEMNDDDWAKLKDITALTYLDLSGATIEAVPASQFSGYCQNLTTVKLPTGLKSIGNSSFYNKSNLVDVYLPTTLESIGSSAFYGCSKLESIHLDVLPSGITEIPGSCFKGCSKLQSFTIPEGVTSIGQYAFEDCKLFTSTIPSTVMSFGSGAFEGAAMNGIDVIINENAQINSSYSHGTFAGTQIKSISLPSTFYKNPGGVILSCKNLTDIYLKSPTVLADPGTVFPGSDIPFLSGVERSNLTIHVPAHLLEAYKLDSYFKNCSNLIVGDATVGDGEFWTISAPLTLSYSRMPSAANIILKNKTSLQIKGSDTQTFGNVVTYGHTSVNSSSSAYGNKDWSMIINTCDNVSITGTYQHKIQTYAKKWYFFCLPFDFKVSDIETEKDSETGKYIKYAIRYYDGANRANTNAASENWKDYENTDIVKAGTGFIIQTSATTWVTFKAQDNASKSYVVSNNPFVKALADNTTTADAHKGWNLVGNPWLCYYNIHKMNYTAPISVWSGSSYVAYSIIDDDYAIRPNEAFFVQSPGNASITFPVEGRQLTNVINSQNATTRGSVERKIFDVQIAYGDMTDKTRLVVNPEASMDFEFNCDASKMMSMDIDVPQIYSFGQDKIQYAINERPADNCELPIGIIFRHDGEYTISSIRNSLGQVLLKDNETGITTDLSENGYTFTAKAGTTEARFRLTFGSINGNGDTTGINTIENVAAEKEFYTLDGVKVGNNANSLQKGVYVVRQGQKTQKMIIK